MGGGDFAVGGGLNRFVFLDNTRIDGRAGETETNGGNGRRVG